MTDKPKCLRGCHPLKYIGGMFHAPGCENGPKPAEPRVHDPGESLIAAYFSAPKPAERQGSECEHLFVKGHHMNAYCLKCDSMKPNPPQPKSEPPIDYSTDPVILAVQLDQENSALKEQNLSLAATVETLRAESDERIAAFYSMWDLADRAVSGDITETYFCDKRKEIIGRLESLAAKRKEVRP